jgi:hypothetical protein
MKKVRFKDIEIAYEKAANDQICNICLSETKLSWDHVPPKGVVGNRAVVIDSLASRLMTGQPFRQNVESQNGVKFKTLCTACNGRLKRGDHFLKKFAQQVTGIIESRICLPRPIMVTLEPNVITRSILGHILAAKTQTDQALFDQNLRPCLKDFSIPIPDNVHVFFWVYPFRTIKIMREFMMPTIRGRFDAFSQFQVLKFYPLAFLVTDTPSYQGLFSLDKFKNIGLEDSVDIPLHVDGLPIEDWPEIVEDGNIITFGRSGIEALYARKK